MDLTEISYKDGRIMEVSQDRAASGELCYYRCWTDSLHL